MEYLDKYMNFINYVESITDIRTRGWFMVNNINVIILTTIAYLLLIRLGKRIMKKRQPFQLKKIILVYNIGIAIVSIYVMYELYISATLLKFSWFCSFKKPIDDSDPNETRLATAIWLYYLTKYVETLDSFFFVLRKKNNQLSGLHLYHHSMMILYSGFSVKWYPVEMTYSPCMINSGIHVIMYIYYGLSTLGPSVARYLWWKKYLTLIQMIQFVFGMTIGIVSMYLDCSIIPSWIAITNLFYILIFLVLFAKFYVASYNKPEQITKDVKQQ